MRVSPSAFEVLTMGRIGVDLYPQQVGVGLDEVESFGKYLGGSASIVAVAAARYSRRSAVITRTGDDPFGDVAVQELRDFGVDTTYAAVQPDGVTPLAFAVLDPPEDPQLHSGEVPASVVADVGVLWISGGALAQEPSRGTVQEMLASRGRARHTVLDLDYRPMFWPSREEARRWVQRALPYVTVAVGNLDECETAVGEREPLAAARALHGFGVKLAVVKQGPKGVLAHDGTTATEVKPVPVDVMNGLGAGDAFGGALCHGLLAGWDIERVMRFANAAGAIVASRLACSDAMPTAAEVDGLLAPEAQETGGPREATSA